MSSALASVLGSLVYDDVEPAAKVLAAVLIIRSLAWLTGKVRTGPQ